MNVYVYPWSATPAEGRHNPYLRHFMTALASHCHVVNREQPTSYGLLGIVPWLWRLDTLVLHWVENIPDKRAGRVQAALLHVLLRAKSHLGLRMVFVLHNRMSHVGVRSQRKQRLVRAVCEHADLVLTHARDGVAVALENGVVDGDRIRYLPLPVASPRAFVSGDEPFDERPWDILVWGTMTPYKGLADFVKTLNEQGLQQRYRILAAGPFLDTAAYEALLKEAPYITFVNRFVTDDELRAFIAASRFILFPYRRESVLSSSALMDSLLSDAFVVGPSAGAFQDCADLGLITTFDRMSDIVEVMERAGTGDRKTLVERRRAFAAEHTWEAFGRQVAAMLAK